MIEEHGSQVTAMRSSRFDEQEGKCRRERDCRKDKGPTAGKWKWKWKLCVRINKTHGEERKCRKRKRKRKRVVELFHSF